MRETGTTVSNRRARNIRDGTTCFHRAATSDFSISDRVIPNTADERESGGAKSYDASHGRALTEFSCGLGIISIHVGTELRGGTSVRRYARVMSTDAMRA